ncbi:hypothetical protein NG829_00440 [Xanthomonas sacchari]|uniref:hypothetical protein n=1 Tax=Xanthomonas sacchari TaxID=56458 RepID=UPI00225E5ED8|nr:hypothetical protein [Xanthomonas sacchari]UYK80835.1 hypothetical protein NG829_00440 [Xanthomonas sacchari]
MHASKRLSFLTAACLFCCAAPALANSNWNLEFEFQNPGGRPTVATMRNYIIGCVPEGSGVGTPLPAGPRGPFQLTTPPVRGREVGDSALYNYLNGCDRKPASVTGIAVMRDD